jgi:hypothetical protein
LAGGHKEEDYQDRQDMNFNFTALKKVGLSGKPFFDLIIIKSLKAV